MYKIVSETESVSNKYGDFKTLELYSEAGFSCLDYSMTSMRHDEHPLNQEGYEEYACKLKARAKELGITFTQAHAPFPVYNFNKEGYNEKTLPRVIRSIEVAGILGIEHIVVHPAVNFMLPPGTDDDKFNIDMYKMLLPYAKKANTVICTENMWGWNSAECKAAPTTCSFAKDMAYYYDTINDKNFSLCLDLGHSGMLYEKAEDAIRVLGNRLGALHIHDNDLRDDQHLLPFMGKINWDEVAKALYDMKYKGNITFEAIGYFNKIPKDEKFVVSSVKYMKSIGEMLISMIEGCENK